MTDLSADEGATVLVPIDELVEAFQKETDEDPAEIRKNIITTLDVDDDGMVCIADLIVHLIRDGEVQ